MAHRLANFGATQNGSIVGAGILAASVLGRVHSIVIARLGEAGYSGTFSCFCQGGAKMDWNGLTAEERLVAEQVVLNLRSLNQ